MADKGAVEVEAPEDLYVLPLDNFTAARDSLARRLKSEGDDDGARAVASLRKPSVAAWALNRVARDDPDAIEKLVQRHRKLRNAGSREAVEDASRQRREMVATLTDQAMDALGSGSQQTRDRINRTLLAVATDTEGESALVAGTLVRELEPTGVGWGEIALPTPPPPDPAVEAKRVVDEARTRSKQAEREAESAEADVETAKERLAQARDRAKRARKAAREAAEDLRRAEEAAR